jgi:hypothetical protein
VSAADDRHRERVLSGRLGAYELWARCEDRAAHTAPARRAFDERFEREVDPDGVLDPAERATPRRRTTRGWSANAGCRSMLRVTAAAMNAGSAMGRVISRGARSDHHSSGLLRRLIHVCLRR